jgi:ABC transporter
MDQDRIAIGPDGQRPALELVGLHKQFGETTAVDHLDLEVPGGSFLGLVGPNGAGKTTTLSMALGAGHARGRAGATPGLMVWLSAASPVPEKDPHRRSGPPSRPPGPWPGSPPAACCTGGAAGWPPGGWPTTATS